MNTTKNKPTTALPWKVIPYRYVLNSATSARIHAENNDPVVDDANPNFDDAAYIAHTANAYPELVEALRDLVVMVNETTNRGNGKAAKSAAALLAKLGEA